MIFGKQITTARVETVQADSAAAAAGFQPGDLVTRDRRHARSRASPTCSESSSGSAGRTLEIEVDRGGVRTILKAVPALREVKDRFGNVHPHRRPRDQPVDRPRRRADRAGSARAAVAMGVEQTWFVIERTMTYLAGVVRGREFADQLGGPIRIAQVSGQVASLGGIAAHQPCGGAVGLDRPAQPVPHPASGWRSPFVLRDRGDARPSPVRAGPGGRVSASGSQSFSC